MNDGKDFSIPGVDLNPTTKTVTSKSGAKYTLLADSEHFEIAFRSILTAIPICATIGVNIHVRYKESAAPDVILESIKQITGFPFEARPDYAACPVNIPVVSYPYGPVEVNRSVSENKLIDKLADVVYDAIAKINGVTITLPKENFKLLVGNSVDDCFPAAAVVPIKQDVLLGNAAMGQMLQEQAIALKNKLPKE